MIQIDRYRQIDISIELIVSYIHWLCCNLQQPYYFLQSQSQPQNIQEQIVRQIYQQIDIDRYDRFPSYHWLCYNLQQLALLFSIEPITTLEHLGIDSQIDISRDMIKIYMIQIDMTQIDMIQIDMIQIDMIQIDMIQIDMIYFIVFTGYVIIYNSSIIFFIANHNPRTFKNI